MNKHKHHIFILMGVSFLLGFSLFVANRPSAQTNLNPPLYDPGTTAHPQCGSAFGKIVEVKPVGSAACLSDSTINYIDSNDSPNWYWKCANSAGTVSCYAIKGAVTIAPPACGSANGKTVEAKPAENSLCANGKFSDISANENKWIWRCTAEDGVVAACFANMTAIQPVAAASGDDVVIPVCGSAHNKTLASTPTGSALCAQGTISGMSDTDNQWSWKCNGTNDAKVNCSATKKMTLPDNADDGSSDGNRAVVKEVPVAMRENVDAATNTETSNDESAEKEERSFDIQKALSGSQQIAPIVQDPVKFQSPKKSGLLNNKMKVEYVGYVNAGSKNKVALAGWAEPNTIVTLYIYSDPIVITVKTDENGDWHYELDKELADGQHEAYVAVTDIAGKIVSKSEPIAFVKTAQAVTQIPVSELTINESPLEKFSKQYVTIAIFIIAGCLTVALIVIGFLTHKHKADESTY